MAFGSTGGPAIGAAPHQRRWRAWLLAGLCLGWDLASLPSAQAASLQLTVTAADGQPLADTVVTVRPLALQALPAPTPRTVVIEQQSLRFVPAVTVAAVGSTVRFVNQDDFDHHVRSLPGGPMGSLPPPQAFELRLSGRNQPARASATLRLDSPGITVLGCHLHSSMRGHLVVVATPWHGLSNARGQVLVDGLPDGPAEVRLWHAAQLADSAPLQITLNGSTEHRAVLGVQPHRAAR